MKRILFSLLIFVFFLFTISVFAADVPYSLDFAGMKLRISEQGRKRIQADMDLLQKNDKYLQMKLERVDMYFPVIEKILEEEGLPDDFKYLAVQESSLVSDAVSTSNAVGYWQFKKESALEVGLVVDSDVDERKHIISATRGAARYLKRNNYFLKNWVFTLLSYNVGLGGAKTIINQRDIGVEKMDIDVRTHWYVIKFLAHKLVFQDVIGKNTKPALTLLPYTDVKGKTLSDIARHMEVSVDNLEMYNKWLNKKRVPEDRDYIVIIPAPTHKASELMARMNTPVPAIAEPEGYTEPIIASQSNLNSAFPELKKKQSRSRANKKVIFYTVNGRPGVQAQPGDNIARLADASGVSQEKFIKYNDLKANEALIPGEVYYLRKKRNRAKVDEHIVTEGETMWQISQKYGLTLAALLKKNRMKRPEKLKHGRVIWLRSTRPSREPIEIRNTPKPPVSVKTPSKPETTPLKTASSKPTEEKTQAPVKSSVEKPPVAKAEERKPAVKTPVEKLVAKAEEKKPVVKPAEEKQPVKPVEEKKVSASPVEEKPVPVVEKKEPVNVATTQTKSDPKPVAEITEAEETTEKEPEIEKPVVKPTVATKAPEPVKSEALQPEVAKSVTLKTHIVSTGQTLYAIGKIYNVTIDQLREWNNLNPSDGLKIGQLLVIEAAPAQPVQEESVPQEQTTEEFIEYTVRKGDNLYKIAKEYAVTVKDIAAWNNKSDLGVSVGEKLKIKPGK